MKRPLLKTSIILLALGATSLADDRLLGIDEKDSLLVVQRDNSTQAIRVEPKTEILLNNKKASLQELQPGYSLRLKLSDAQTATRVEATGLANAKKAEAEIPPMRSVTVRVKIDGSDTFYFDGSSLRIEHDIFRRPEEFLINGRGWTPQWQGDRKAEFKEFSPALQPVESTRPTFKQISGRSKASIVKADDKKTHAIKIEDTGLGADVYEFRWSW